MSYSEFTPRVAPVLDHGELRNAWVAFLGRWQWHWFCTFTFDPKRHSSPNGFVHPEKALKAVLYFMHNLNRSLYGKRWKQRGEGVHYAIALEYHKSGILHLHALVGATEDLNVRASRVEWKEWWHDKFGIARIEQPTEQNGVAAYCTKYTVKGGEIELSDTLKRAKQQLGLGLSGSRTK